MISNTALIIILVLFGFITLIVFLRAVLFSKQERTQTLLRRRRRNMIYPEQILMQPNIMQPNIMQPNIIMETEETMVQPETNANTNTPTPYEMV